MKRAVALRVRGPGCPGDEQRWDLRLCDLRLRSARHRRADLGITRLYRTVGARHRVSPARLAGRGVVLTGRRAGICGALLSGAPAAHAPGTQDDRAGGRRAMPTGRCVSCATRPGTRSTPRTACAAAPAGARCSARLAAAIALAIPGAAGQSPPRAAPRRVVRAGAPDRGFCRNLRGLAATQVRAGGVATPRGPPGASSNTWRRWPPRSAPHRPAVRGARPGRGPGNTTRCTLREALPAASRRLERRRHRRRLADRRCGKVFADKRSARAVRRAGGDAARVPEAEACCTTLEQRARAPTARRAAAAAPGDRALRGSSSCTSAARDAW